ncbi:hypothetical protein JHK87_002920 [Glycine soja]|nr:hypothetical protein JHK87_002920 [Glycine soja]
MANDTSSNESSSSDSDKDKASPPSPSSSSSDSESPKSAPSKSPLPSPPPSPSPPPPEKSSPPPTEPLPAPDNSPPPTPSQSPPPTPSQSPPPSPSPPTPPSPPLSSTPPPSKDSAPPPSPSEPPPSPPQSSPPPPQNSPPAPQSQAPPPHSLSPPTAIQTPLSPGSHVTPPPAPTGSGPNHPSPPRSPPSTQPKPSGAPPKNDPPSTSPSSGNNTGETVGLALAGVVMIAFLALVIFFIFRRKQKRAGVYAMPPPRKSHMKGGGADVHYFVEEPGFGSGAQGAINLRSPSEPAQHMNTGQLVFTYEKIAEITNGFASENIIGEGGFGYVYKASMPDGRVGALKMLKAGSGQGEREFRAEVDIISRIHHRHLVSLIGYCISEQQRVLIYEFVPNGNLSQHLHGSERPILDWPKRMKIAIGSARGLAYLHDGCNPKIIHRDIKSANILLDNAYEAQVADFGLARLTDDSNTHVSTRARPLLLRAVETGDFGELVDPRLERQYADTEMFRMIETAAACVRHSAPKRPRMVQVARSLDSGDQQYDLSNGVKYGQSTIYDSGQYNEDITIFKRMVNGSFDDSEFDMDSTTDYRSTVSREMSGSRHARMLYSEGGDSDYRVFHGQRSNTQNMS